MKNYFHILYLLDDTEVSRLQNILASHAMLHPARLIIQLTQIT